MPTPLHQLLSERLRRLPPLLEKFRAIRPESLDLDHDDIADALDCGLVRTDCVQHGHVARRLLLPGRNIRQFCGTTDIIRPPVKGHRLQMALLADLAIGFQRTGWEGHVDRRLRAMTAGYADHTFLVRPDPVKFANVVQNVATIQLRTASRVVLYVPMRQVESLLYQFTAHFKKTVKVYKTIEDYAQDGDTKRAELRAKRKLEEAVEEALSELEILPFDIDTWPPKVRKQS